MTLRVLHQTMQYVHLLQNTTDSNHLSFNKGHFDENQLLQEEISINSHKGNLYYYYTCNLEVYYLNARYSDALTFAEQSKELEAAMLVPVKQKHCFYHALAILAIYPSTPNHSRRRYRKILNQLLARMKQWTKLVPESTLSKYSLILAEKARLGNDHSKAVKHYNHAIQQAQEFKIPQDEAVAYELAAHYYFSLKNNTKAENYLQNACKAYYKWGANRKVKSLQERYPFLMTLPLLEDDFPEELYDRAEMEKVNTDGVLKKRLEKELNWDTLRQASKLAFKERAETELLENFLDMAILNAGAEKGIVLLGKEGQLEIMAERNTNQCVQKPVTNEDIYSTSIIQFVMRTRESVLLGEARHSIFTADSYIRQKRPRSILCLPIRYPDNKTGVLYLENNLISYAFTSDRLEVLEMVFSRMAYLKLWKTQDNSIEASKEIHLKFMPPLVESLSNREIDVLRLMADGLSNKEIAVQLGITEGTVKIHAFNIYGKLQVKRRIQAISKAKELQLLN
jgi:DNA-binding CsgD family transcriptional regulator